MESERRGGAVDLQHGTGVDGSLHPCTTGYYPNKGFYIVRPPHL
jgi:hypothetical protein